MELQKIALIGLLTMFFYFLMVQFWDTPKVASPGTLQLSENETISNRLPESTRPNCPAAAFLPKTDENKPPSWDERNKLATPFQAAKGHSVPKESNADLFEKTADFTSDVTNINQFYKNNPDVLNRISNADWDFPKMAAPAQSNEILGYNFDRNFTSLL
jgi:hypothetical protein